jgi:transglutaminase-like putative cysteine protease
LAYRTGSCLGKSALLASIYRAMGMPSEDVRLVMGMVITPQGLAEHVWLDLELQGQCLQQDPSGMLGQFDPGEFPGNRYVETYVMKETFCFNDRDFAVVSQLNRFKNGGTMPGQ